MLLDLLPDILVETKVLPTPSDKVPCEMADPVTYCPNGRDVETFQPCGVAAEWRLVLRWHHSPEALNEHVLCERHLSIWQTFRAVENPPWDIVLLTRI